MTMLMFLLDGATGDALQWTSPALTSGLAAWIFYFYRQDRKDARERLRHLMERYHKISEEFRGIVERNTAAVTELTVVVKRLNGRH